MIFDRCRGLLDQRLFAPLWTVQYLTCPFATFPVFGFPHSSRPPGQVDINPDFGAAVCAHNRDNRQRKLSVSAPKKVGSQPEMAPLRVFGSRSKYLTCPSFFFPSFFLNRRPIFNATLRAAAGWLFFRVARSTRMTQIWALRSRLATDVPWEHALQNSQLPCGDIPIICETVH